MQIRNTGQQFDGKEWQKNTIDPRIKIKTKTLVNDILPIDDAIGSSIFNLFKSLSPKFCTTSLKGYYLPCVRRIVFSKENDLMEYPSVVDNSLKRNRRVNSMVTCLLGNLIRRTEAP